MPTLACVSNLVYLFRRMCQEPSCVCDSVYEISFAWVMRTPLVYECVNIFQSYFIHYRRVTDDSTLSRNMQNFSKKNGLKEYLYAKYLRRQNFPSPRENEGCLCLIQASKDFVQLFSSTHTQSLREVGCRDIEEESRKERKPSGNLKGTTAVRKSKEGGEIQRLRYRIETFGLSF